MEEDTNCFCKCNDNNWQESGPMVSCEACGHWYHYTCICENKIKLINQSFICGNQVRFVCGFKNCNFNEGFLNVRGTTYKLKQIQDLRFTLDTVEKRICY